LHAVNPRHSTALLTRLAGTQDLPVFDLMSIVGKIRAGLGAMGIRPPPPGYEESVEEFVRRNLVRCWCTNGCQPYCSSLTAASTGS
jgi:oxygen-dependent protoporphyrinogen oxidase